MLVELEDRAGTAWCKDSEGLDLCLGFPIDLFKPYRLDTGKVEVIQESTINKDTENIRQLIGMGITPKQIIELRKEGLI